MKKKIYVAGSYTKGNQTTNVRSAIDAANVLAGYGFVPFVPHLTHFWDLLWPHEYDWWMAYDDEWLQVCDAVLRLPGESLGADKEEERARELGIPVFYSLDELLLWSNG